MVIYIIVGYNFVLYNGINGLLVVVDELFIVNFGKFREGFVMFDFNNNKLVNNVDLFDLDGWKIIEDLEIFLEKGNVCFKIVLFIDML